jgi:DNA-binding NtrC family response regulator
VGGLKDIPLDLRVIAASNRDLKTEGEAGRFRADLYYRFSVIQIDLPPPRERGDDALVLTMRFIEHFNQKLCKQVRGLAPEVAATFRHYAWPGNVRELRKVIERVMILEDNDLITPACLPRSLMLEETPAPVVAVAAASAPVAAASAPISVAPPVSVAPAIPETCLEQRPPLDVLFRLPATGVQLEEVELSLVRQAMRPARSAADTAPVFARTWF